MNINNPESFMSTVSFATRTETCGECGKQFRHGFIADRYKTESYVEFIYVCSVECGFTFANSLQEKAQDNEFLNDYPEESTMNEFNCNIVLDQFAEGDGWECTTHNKVGANQASLLIHESVIAEAEKTMNEFNTYHNIISKPKTGKRVVVAGTLFRNEEGRRIINARYDFPNYECLECGAVPEDDRYWLCARCFDKQYGSGDVTCEDCGIRGHLPGTEQCPREML